MIPLGPTVLEEPFTRCTFYVLLRSAEEKGLPSGTRIVPCLPDSDVVLYLLLPQLYDDAYAIL